MFIDFIKEELNLSSDELCELFGISKKYYFSRFRSNNYTSSIAFTNWLIELFNNKLFNQAMIHKYGKRKINNIKNELKITISMMLSFIESNLILKIDGRNMNRSNWLSKVFMFIYERKWLYYTIIYGFSLAFIVTGLVLSFYVHYLYLIFTLVGLVLVCFQIRKTNWKKTIALDKQKFLAKFKKRNKKMENENEK